MTSAWSDSWGSSWNDSWGDVGAVIPVGPVATITGGGTTRRYRRRYERHGVILGRKEYEEILVQLVAKAAAKTAAVVERKRIEPTKRAVIAATRKPTVNEAERLQGIWAQTAVALAEFDAIETRQYRMAQALAAHFARLAQQAEDDDEDVLLLAA